jgi:membrane protease YdiL (CAAX protease family)
MAPLIWFFGLSYGMAWVIWIAIGLLIPDLEADRGTFLTVPGAWAPTVAAILVTARREGRAGLRLLLSQLIRWRIGWGRVGLAVLGPTAMGLLALGMHSLLGGQLPSLEAIAAGLDIPPEEAPRALVAFPFLFLVLCLGGPLAEELGWRGFAQPRLQARIGAGPAGVAIGVVWSLWHLPLIVFVPSGTGEVAPWFYLPFVAALGVIFAWGYNRTGGSVLFCILLHAGVNTFFAYRLVTATQSPQLYVIALAIAIALAALAFRQLGTTPAGDPDE